VRAGEALANELLFKKTLVGAEKKMQISEEEPC